MVLVAGLGPRPPARWAIVPRRGIRTKDLRVTSCPKGHEFESYFADFRPSGTPYRVYLLIHGSNEPGDIKFWQ